MCLAIPGQILGFREDGHLAEVEVGGVRRTVNVDLVRDEGVCEGDWVLIHVGFAMSRVSEGRAREQLELLDLLGEADSAREEVEGYGTGELDAP